MLDNNTGIKPKIMSLGSYYGQNSIMVLDNRGKIYVSGSNSVG